VANVEWSLPGGGVFTYADHSKIPDDVQAFFALARAGLSLPRKRYLFPPRGGRVALFSKPNPTLAA
jgi:hypothetical protein